MDAFVQNRQRSESALGSIQKPDYHGGSIVNLMASIVLALGGEESRYPPLRMLDPARLASRNIVLVVIDGLGHDNLKLHGANGALARHVEDRLTSVFPATTATAVTTFLTGTAPQQHGVTGWFTYFRELGSVIAVLPFRPRYGGPPLTIRAQDLFQHTPVFDRLRARSHVVAPERIIHSAYNVAHQGVARLRPFAKLADMFHAVNQIVRASTERTYVYAYWPEFDRLAHEHGCASREAVMHLGDIDRAFASFLHSVAGSDTTVIVTADHGFIDARPDQLIELDVHPRLARTLVLPLCGERRAAFCYVHAGQRQEFVNYVEAHLAEHADLHDSATLVESGYFGLGPPHPQLHERIGDYTLVMKHDAAIKDWLLGEERHVHVGVHGGASAAEMYVPLIVAQV